MGKRKTGGLLEVGVEVAIALAFGATLLICMVCIALSDLCKRANVVRRQPEN